jgi:hypothetical protein
MCFQLSGYFLDHDQFLRRSLQNRLHRKPLTLGH